MALFFSLFTRGAQRMPAPQDNDVVAVRFEHTLTAAQNATGNIIDFGILPADSRVVDAVLDADDLDSGSAALTLDVGLMTGSPGESLDAAGNARTSGAEYFSASTVGQAGTVERMSLKGGFRVASVAYDRSIGLKVGLQSATAVAGKVGLTVFLAPG